MNLPLKILLLGLCGLIAVGAVCFFWLRARMPKEPSYNGRTLSEWLSVGTNPHVSNLADPKLKEAEDAVRQIGSSGVPFLIKWNEALDSRKRANAFDGFRILGTNASAAFPYLTNGFLTATKSDAIRRFGYEIGFLEGDACKFLLPIACWETDGPEMKAGSANFQRRHIARNALYMLGRSAAEIRSTVASLLLHPDEETRQWATNMIARIDGTTVESE